MRPMRLKICISKQFFLDLALVAIGLLISLDLPTHTQRDN